MRTVKLILSTLLLTAACWGWNCPTGQIRQQAPAGTPVTAPYYDVVEGIAFICVPTNPTPTPTLNSNTNNNTNNNTNTVNSASTSTSNSNQTQAQKQKQQQNQNQTQTATGGVATAASTSTSTGGNAVGNGVNSNNSITNIAAPKIPVATAIAPPALPSAPCIKGYGAGVQTGLIGGSFGGGKVDQGCDDRELARAFAGPQTLASCKILLATKKAKAAGITMEDCLPAPIPVQITVAPPPSVTELPSITVNCPPMVAVPVLTPEPPQYRTEITVTPKKKVQPHHMKPECQNGMELRCVAKGKQ